MQAVKGLKTCSRCRESLTIESFSKNRTTKDGFAYECKQCRVKINRKWYKSNPQKNWEHRQTYLKNKPWAKHYCSTKGSAKQRGLEHKLTTEQIEQLWHRDEACKMKRPSIDRIDNEQGYIFENCMFIELGDNIRKSFVDRKNKL